MIRSPARAAAAAALTAVAALGIMLSLLVPTRAAAATSHQHDGVRLVVVLAVPDLRWSDLSAMPTVRKLAGQSAVASMADKTVGGSTGCLDGDLAMAAGTRTRAPAGATASDCADSDPAAVTSTNRSDGYDADVVALGTALNAAGVLRLATGPGAATVLAGPGHVSALPGGRALAAAAVGGAGPDRKVIALQYDDLIAAGHAKRSMIDRSLDRSLAQVIDGVPRSALLLLLGSSDSASGVAHLHVAMARGPGFRPGDSLTSASTGRAAYVQLIDVAPTILSALDVDYLPTTFDGAEMTDSGSRAPTVSGLVDADRHARAALPGALGLRAVLITLVGVALILLVCSIWRSGARFAAVLLARVAAPLAVTSWLGQLVPWWRAGSTWLIAGCLIVGVAYAWLMTLLRARGLPGAVELLVIPAATSLLLLVDQLVGGGLQVSAALGDDPLEAGRFAGIGNIDFAILAAGALLGAAVLSAWTHRLIVAVAIIGVVVVVDGAPPLGDDLGGLLTLVPAGALTLTLLAGLRVSLRRVVAAAGLAIGLAVVAALADYSRPAADQSHLGHFVGQLLHGGAATTLRRKIASTLELQGELPLVAGVVAVATRRRWWSMTRDWLSRTPGLLAAAGGVSVVAVLGSLVNDSGLSVAVFAVTAVLPAVIGATVDQPS